MAEVMTPEQFRRWNARLEAARRRAAARHPYWRGRRSRRSLGLRRPQPPTQHRPWFARYRAAEVLRRLDRNHDGRLVAEEVPPPFWAKLKRADTDDDGAVSRAELEALARSRRR